MNKARMAAGLGALMATAAFAPAQKSMSTLASPATPQTAAPHTAPQTAPQTAAPKEPVPAPQAPAAAPLPQAPVAAAAPAVQGGKIRGTVVAGTAGQPGGVPLPGVSVTATNTLTGKKYSTATDVDGLYAMAIPRNGRYVIRAELAGFALATQEVVLTGAELTRPKVSNFGMNLASRAAAAEAKAATASTRATGQARGLQNLSLSAGGLDATDASEAASGTADNAGTSMPSLSNLGDSANAATSDAVTVSGQTAQMNGLANFSEDEIRQRVSDAVAQARTSGQLPEGADPTNAIVGLLGGLMAGPGPGGRGGGGFGGGGGGRGGGGGGGRGGGGGGSGAFRNFNPNQLHGGLNYSGDFSELDSAQWSPTLQPVAKPSYVKNSFGASLAGSPYIPGLTQPSPKQFVFLNFNGQRNTTPQILNGTVPTLAERGQTQNADGSLNNNADANFSGLTQNVNGVQTPVTLYDPASGGLTPFANNIIPNSRISTQAQNVLRTYYPLCNINCQSTDPTLYNYQTITTAGANSANLAARYVRTIGDAPGGLAGSFAGRGGRGGANAPLVLRQNLNVSFNYSHSASDVRTLFLPLGGATESEGYNLGAGYVISYGKLSNNTNVTWNRSHATTRNYFTDTSVNPAGLTQINLPSQADLTVRPNFYNGLPNLSITGFSGLGTTAPGDNIGQTISYTDFVSYRHNKHNMRYGFDIRRVHSDSLGGNNPLGTFTFSGYGTESASDQANATSVCAPSATNACTSTVQATTGAGFADFLLGLPQQTKIQAGLSKIYLRENVFDWYVNDDFRVKANVTINYGLRYEYFGPYSEKNNRLANLTGVSSYTTSVGCVTPTGITVGGLTCAAGPNAALINPDHTMYSPRFGIAYKPLFLKTFFKDTVLRGGYGINFNTGQYSTFAKSLSYQPPFAAVQNNVLQSPSNLTGCSLTVPAPGSPLKQLTLANGFGCSNKLYQNSFAVNPDYRLGYVQVYNLDIQRTLPLGIVLNLGYNGSKGSDLDVTRAPNHTSSTVTTPNAVAFTYEDSIAASHFNALTVNARMRQRKGVALGATYQYAHSIDDASSFGGASSATSIQNDARLDLERSNSSFDVRHKLTGNWVYELPVGPNRAFLNKGGFFAAALDGFSISGDFTFTSGAYYTPSYSSTAAQIAAGGTYALRPDRVFSQPTKGTGKLAAYFNEAAFSFPVSPDGYGTASRYSIQGPGTVATDASLSRTLKLGDTRSFEMRATATNVFNTVQYNGINTTLNSATYGRVTGAGTMRRILFVARYRF